ncbi:Vacuolar fusion protein MON1 A [Balamuthia mandrillaris]
MEEVTSNSHNKGKDSPVVVVVGEEENGILGHEGEEEEEEEEAEKKENPKLMEEEDFLWQNLARFEKEAAARAKDEEGEKGTEAKEAAGKNIVTENVLPASEAAVVRDMEENETVVDPQQQQPPQQQQSLQLTTTTTTTTTQGTKKKKKKKKKEVGFGDEYFRDTWPKYSKHIFIMSSAGKPVYSRYGDEQKLCSFMPVLSAISSFVVDAGDTIKTIIAGQHKIVFLFKGPLYLVAVSKTPEPAWELERQLEYIHSQIISSLTSGVNKIYKTRPHFDIRDLQGSTLNLRERERERECVCVCVCVCVCAKIGFQRDNTVLKGSNKLLDNMMNLLDNEPSFLASFLLDSIRCLRLPYAARSAIGTVLQSFRMEDLVYAVLLADGQLVSLVCLKKHVLHPHDFHLILNFINSSPSIYANGASTVPICLPKFNDRGYLHSYVCYLVKGVRLLLIATKAGNLEHGKNQIEKGLAAVGALRSIAEAQEKRYYNVDDVGVSIKSLLLHFLYKDKRLSQFTSPALEPPYNVPSERQRLYRLYERVHHTVNMTGSGKEGPHKIYYHISARESVLAWVTQGFELYATFGPLVPKAASIKACNELLRWLRGEEENLFMLDSLTW